MLSCRDKPLTHRQFPTHSSTEVFSQLNSEPPAPLCLSVSLHLIFHFPGHWMVIGAVWQELTASVVLAFTVLCCSLVIYIKSLRRNERPGTSFSLMDRSILDSDQWGKWVEETGDQHKWIDPSEGSLIVQTLLPWLRLFLFHNLNRQGNLL